MKYRRLTNQELKEIETAFVRFLASNSVTADDWVKIKTTDTQKAENLIALFSDIVFDSTLEKVEYLEFKTKNDIKLFHCLKDKMVLRGMFIEGESLVDFTKDQTAEEIMRSIQSCGASVKIFKAEKEYKKERKRELFEMMEGGCLISNGMLFKTLEGLE